MTLGIRHDWRDEEILSMFDLPFAELMMNAATIHRRYFDPTEIQVASLLSIKTGGCPEDCAYCPQSQHYDTGIKAEKIMASAEVEKKARAAKSAGASRFCMGAAWRSLKDRDLPRIAEMIGAVKALGMETCATLGLLTAEQAQALKSAGLDYYNHNLDCAPEMYSEIISTRGYQDRLETLRFVREAGLKTCCGGIVGMGETRTQRAAFLKTLANLPQHPDSVPINRLVQTKGTPLYGTTELDSFEFVRTIAICRIMMPESIVRLSAGRERMNEEMQALCFLAGANSIFMGERLLTAPNSSQDCDQSLLDRLGFTSTPYSGATAHTDISQ